MPGMPTDPWVIVLMCPTQANAKLMLQAMRDAGIESSAAIAKRSEARAILGEMNPNASTYNRSALNDMESDKERAVIQYKKKAQAPRANRSRL